MSDGLKLELSLRYRPHEFLRVNPNRWRTVEACASGTVLTLATGPVTESSPGRREPQQILLEIEYGKDKKNTNKVI